MRFSGVDLYTMLHSPHCAKLLKFVTEFRQIFTCKINGMDGFSSPGTVAAAGRHWRRGRPHPTIRTELSTGLETALSCGF
jgi:hypothetical protein